MAKMGKKSICMLILSPAVWIIQNQNTILRANINQLLTTI